MSILVNTYRGEVLDLFTTGTIAVSDAAGKLLYSVGDTSKIAFARSSAKLMQAMVPIYMGATGHYGFTEREIAQICASHSGEAIHVETVRGILQKIGLDESYLQCGVHYPFKEDVTQRMKERGEPALQIHNNCSGKHAGMLACAHFLGEDLDSYFQLAHPHQQRIIDTIADVCGYARDKIQLGLDGCGVPVHALSVERFAYGFARLCQPETLPEKYQDAASQVVTAVMNNPVISSGSDRIDFKIMSRYPGEVVVKSGADGYFAGGLPKQGIGFALKTDDGNAALRNVVLIELLHQIGLIPEADLPYFAPEHKILHYNHKGELASESRAVFQLERH